jgi:hypothetical protein
MTMPSVHTSGIWTTNPHDHQVEYEISVTGERMSSSHGRADQEGTGLKPESSDWESKTPPSQLPGE